MAIYSCNLRSIGRTTHAEGTAGAHLLYIGRERAASELVAANMPEDPQQARTWMDRHEREARKNARLCDKLRIALPRELDEAQRAQLVREYMDGLTGGRVPWFAAIHQDGKDAANPHAHIVIVDRDLATGRRVLGLSDSLRDRQKKGLPGPSAVEWVRERWEHHANAALARAGHEARIDRRTLAAQGIDREAQIHIGPRANHIDTQVKRPESRIIPDPTRRYPQRVIDYPLIDAGRTRRERNAEIIDLNIERDARSPHFETRVLAQFEREQRSRDRIIEARLIAGARRRTLEERRILKALAAQRKDIRGRRDAEKQFTRDWLRAQHQPQVQALRQRQAAERSDLASAQNRLFARFFEKVDLTGRTRRKREAVRAALSVKHRHERATLAGGIREARQGQAQAIEARYRPELDDLAREGSQKLARLHDRHGAEQAKEDMLLQAREAEREQARSALLEQIETWRQTQSAQGRTEGGEESGGQDRSRLGEDWKDKDSRTFETTEERIEAARKRREGQEKQDKQDGRRRRYRRSFE